MKEEFPVSNTYQNIVVAVDGSTLSNYAFKKAIDVAKRNVGATLHIIHVIDTSVATSFDMLYDNMVELIRQHGEVLLTGCETQAKDAGLESIKTILTKGVPKQVLSKKLDEHVQADLIVCGATGVNAVEQIFIGSNTDAIVRHAKCDVLVVRTPEQ